MRKNLNILVTGGAGYIGSHTVFELLNQGNNVTIIDNLSTGHKRLASKDAELIECDLIDYERMYSLTKSKDFDCVIHFASRSIVTESMMNPILYLESNVRSAINLLKLMIEKKIPKIIFSSSAAVYGLPITKKIKENHPRKPINPYGTSKLLIENILKSLFNTKKISSLSLRYFNAAGANFKMGIGEMHDPETHLIPSILKSTFSKNPFYVYGDDYSTKDGSCIRDYINVSDIADAHIQAIDWLENNPGSNVMNLGTANGFSVLEILKKCSEIIEKEINFIIKPRRDGDPEILIADAKLAKKELNWTPKKSIDQSIYEAYKWEMLNQ